MIVRHKSCVHISIPVVPAGRHPPLPPYAIGLIAAVAALAITIIIIAIVLFLMRRTRKRHRTEQKPKHILKANVDRTAPELIKTVRPRPGNRQYSDPPSQHRAGPAIPALSSAVNSYEASHGSPDYDYIDMNMAKPATQADAETRSQDTNTYLNPNVLSRVPSAPNYQQLNTSGKA